MAFQVTRLLQGVLRHAASALPAGDLAGCGIEVRVQLRGLRYNLRAMSAEFEAGYLRLGLEELRKRAEEALRRLEECRLCARECGVNRLQGELGTCRTGRYARVSSAFPHFGEERPLVGRAGSGTIFFAWCNLRCVFCQNHDISQSGHGQECDAETIARAMVELQRLGCHNVNFVSPSHVVAQILEALVLAVQRGLRVPLVYNTGTYDALETLRLLDGILDIYMPDSKYGDDQNARTYSDAPGYPEVMKAALREMHRQVGDLEMDENGVAKRGVLVRHLVMPNGIAGSREVLQFIARELGPRTYINIMGQYRPEHRAMEFDQIARRPTRQEMEEVVRTAGGLGLTRLDDRWLFV